MGNTTVGQTESPGQTGEELPAKKRLPQKKTKEGQAKFLQN